MPGGLKICLVMVSTLGIVLVLYYSEFETNQLLCLSIVEEYFFNKHLPCREEHKHFFPHLLFHSLQFLTLH